MVAPGVFCNNITWLPELNYFEVIKTFWSKNFWVKKFWVKKFFGSKFLLVNKIFGSNFLGDEGNFC